jgi:hypothetical protein
MCGHCVKKAKENHRAAPTEFWDDLLSIYDLPPWYAESSRDGRHHLGEFLYLYSLQDTQFFTPKLYFCVCLSFVHLPPGKKIPYDFLWRTSSSTIPWSKQVRTPSSSSFVLLPIDTRYTIHDIAVWIDILAIPRRTGRVSGDAEVYRCRGRDGIDRARARSDIGTGNVADVSAIRIPLDLYFRTPI